MNAVEVLRRDARVANIKDIPKFKNTNIPNLLSDLGDSTCSLSSNPGGRPAKREVHNGVWRSQKFNKESKNKHELQRPSHPNLDDPYYPDVHFPCGAKHLFYGGRKLKSKKTRQISTQDAFEMSMKTVIKKSVALVSRKRKTENADELTRRKMKRSTLPFSTMCALCYRERSLVITFRSQTESNKHMLAMHQNNKWLIQ